MSRFVYDPFSPEFQERAPAVYRTLRDQHPVYHNADRGFWSLSRFEDVWDAVHDTESYSTEGMEESESLLPMINFLDPPRHHQLRALVSRAFTPARVERLEPSIRRIACELLEAFRDAGRCDLMREFASQLPSLVMSDLIGVPDERRAEFLALTEGLVETDPELSIEEHIREISQRIYAEFELLLADRRVQREGDLMSALLDAEIDGERLTREEILGFCFQLIVAGNDTTTNLIGNGAVLLARHPEQRALLAADPSRIPSAVEEMLRFEPPAQALPRRTVREVALHGQVIPAGVRLLLVWAAANRDEREFEHPERFDITRQIKRHLSFGHGIHYCLGANLARLEARVAFEELLARHPEYALEQQPRWVTSRWARAHAAIPIRLANGPSSDPPVH